jgi:hypothetical protein
MTHLSESLPPPQRPVLVWVICLLAFAFLPIGLILLVLHVVESQNYVDYSLQAIGYIVNLTWAIQLFRLRRQALLIYIGALALGLFTLLYGLLAEDLLATLEELGVLGFVVSVVAWTLNFALLYYIWRLSRKGVLR